MIYGILLVTISIIFSLFFLRKVFIFESSDMGKIQSYVSKALAVLIAATFITTSIFCGITFYLLKLDVITQGGELEKFITVLFVYVSIMLFWDFIQALIGLITFPLELLNDKFNKDISNKSS